MSLIPCKFYAQGTCRYGNNCRFYHDARGQTQTGMFGNRTLAPATFQPAGGFNNQAALNLNAKSNQNLDIIVEGVKKDMQEWQSCNIWPYSCYGPVGGKSCVPGFEDVSPEEFRLAFMLNGNVLPPEMAQRFQQIHQFRLSYQQSTIENRNTIERIATSNATQSPFGGQTTTTQSQQAGLFKGASNQQPGSIFGGSSGFPAQQSVQGTPSLFGGSAFGSVPANTFSQSQPSTLSNVFQNPPSQTPGIFGGQQTQGQTAFVAGFQNPQQTASLFQPSQQQQQTGIFQSPTPGLGSGSFFPPSNTQPQQGGLFSQQPNLLNNAPLQPQGGLFQQPQLQQQLQLQQQPSSGLFQTSQQPQPGQPLTQTSVASAPLFNQPQPSLFPPTTGSMFGGNISQQQPNTPSMFGGATTSTTFPAPGNIQQQGSVIQVTQKFVYSDEADLSPEELESFKATEFTIDSLPTKPPPQSLCL